MWDVASLSFVSSLKNNVSQICRIFYEHELKSLFLPLNHYIFGDKSLCSKVITNYWKSSKCEHMNVVLLYHETLLVFVLTCQTWDQTPQRVGYIVEGLEYESRSSLWDVRQFDSLTAMVYPEIHSINNKYTLQWHRLHTN